MRQLVLFLILLLFINTQCALYEKVKNTGEEAVDTAKENLHRGRDYANEKLEEGGDTVKEMYHRAKDTASGTLEDIKEAVGDTFQKVKDAGARLIGRNTVADRVGETLNEGKEAVRDSYYTGKRKFSKYTNMLEESYHIGWDKIDRWYRLGKLKTLDFKDALGEKYDDFVDYLGEKVEQGKDLILPRRTNRVKDIYELFWDNVEELVSSGKLNADQIKNFIGDKFEDVKEFGKDKLDVDSKDLERWKSTLLEWNEKLFKPEEKKTWWNNFMGKFSNMRDSVKNSLGMESKSTSSSDNSGWDILNQLISNKRLNMEDVKELLGDKFESFSKYLNLNEDNVKEVANKVGDNARWWYDFVHDHLGDLFEGDFFNVDYLYEIACGFIPDDGIAGRSRKEIVKDIDNLKETIIQLKNKFIGESHPKTFWERFKDRVSSVTNSAKEKLGIQTKSRPRRMFDQATNKLEDLYNVGWKKLDYFFKHGKLSLEDFKDLLGEKYEEIFNFLSEKLEAGVGIMHSGKRILKNPERLRDIYELIWDYVDEQYRKGNIKFEQIKDLIGDNFDDVADTVVEGIDKGKDIINKATGSNVLDLELDRLKRKILEMKNNLSEHTQGGFWSNLVDMVSNWKNRAFGKAKQPSGWSKNNNRDRQDTHTSSTEL